MKKDHLNVLDKVKIVATKKSGWGGTPFGTKCANWRIRLLKLQKEKGGPPQAISEQQIENPVFVGHTRNERGGAPPKIHL